ncbi:MAG TPA: hypothetical protein VF777_12555 [Phycisphaerales bacterium]
MPSSFSCRVIPRVALAAAGFLLACPAPAGPLNPPAGPIIIRNSARGNTIVNWSIVANNVVGPIVNRIAPGSPSISGDSAISSLGTTDPNANFTH